MEEAQHRPSFARRSHHVSGRRGRTGAIAPLAALLAFTVPLAVRCHAKKLFGECQPQ